MNLTESFLPMQCLPFVIGKNRFQYFKKFFKGVVLVTPMINHFQNKLHFDEKQFYFIYHSFSFTRKSMKSSRISMKTIF